MYVLRIKTTLLLALLSLLPSIWPAYAGWIEQRDNKTVIHVKLDLPYFYRTDTASRAEIAVVQEFIRSFPETFERRYRAKYEANPERYGHYDWSRVEIELHRHTGIRVEKVEDSLLAIAGGIAPDVMYVNFRQSDTFIQRGFLYPLDRQEDDYINSMSDDEIAFRIHPKIWPVIKRKGPERETHVWAVPYGGALGKVLLYRKDLFDAAGVAYPDASWTWDDFMDACRKITDPANGIYGVRFGRGQHESWYWMTFLWSAGGEAMTYDEESGAWRAAFASREAAVAMDFYTRLCAEPWFDEEGRKRYGYAYKDTSDVSAKWSRGEIGMMFNYIDGKLFTQINPEVTGMAPVPLGPTGIRGAELNSRMMGLFSGIEEPAVRDAAWEYIRFYDSKTAVALRTKIMVEGGLGRFINPEYLRMFGYEEIIRLAPRGWSDIFKIAIESGRPEPYGKNANSFYLYMTKPLQAAEQMAVAGELPDDEEERLALFERMLSDTADEVREKMFEEIPPSERKTRSRAAMAVIIVLVVVFAWVFRYVAKSFQPPPLEGIEQRVWQFGRYKVAYMLLLPAVITIAMWQYFPLAWGSLMAFQDFNILGASDWVGLKNFGDLLWDQEWWMSCWHAFRYSVLVIVLTFIPPVLLAILLQEVPRGKVLFRTLYYIPGMLTGLVVILLWKSFYEPDESGALNAVLMKIPAIGFFFCGILLAAVAWSFAKRLTYHRLWFMSFVFVLVGIALLYTCFALAEPIMAQGEMTFVQKLFSTLPEPYRWLLDRETAMLACVIPLLWAGIGPGCLIYLAALKGIGDELYEAADIDGSTFVDKILFIVFPRLKALLIINFVGVFIASWNAEANILAMTGGAADTEVAGLHLFYKAYIHLQFGPATAMAWVLALILIGFTVYQLRILSKLEFRTAGDGE